MKSCYVKNKVSSDRIAWKLLRLSEHKLDSDKTSWKPPGTVRRRAVFEQLSSFLALACPKATLVRTAFLFFGFVLSKHDLCSDSFPMFWPSFVRRTPCSDSFPLFGFVLSEHDLCSDSFPIFWPSFVRRQPMFGQLSYFLALFCPNTPYVQTAF